MLGIGERQLTAQRGDATRRLAQLLLQCELVAIEDRAPADGPERPVHSEIVSGRTEGLLVAVELGLKHFDRRAERARVVVDRSRIAAEGDRRVERAHEPRQDLLDVSDRVAPVAQRLPIFSRVIAALEEGQRDPRPLFAERLIERRVGLGVGVACDEHAAARVLFVEAQGRGDDADGAQALMRLVVGIFSLGQHDAAIGAKMSVDDLGEDDLRRVRIARCELDHLRDASTPGRILGAAGARVLPGWRRRDAERGIEKEQLDATIACISLAVGGRAVQLLSAVVEGEILARAVRGGHDLTRRLGERDAVERHVLGD